jgi:hypothetical protein
LKIEKTIKKIRKAIERDAALLARANVTDSETFYLDITAKDRGIFRYVRDQLDGEAASKVNHVYGIGGTMKMICDPKRLTLVLFDDHGKKVDRVMLDAAPEPEAADDANYSLPA